MSEVYTRPVAAGGEALGRDLVIERKTQAGAGDDAAATLAHDGTVADRRRSDEDDSVLRLFGEACDGVARMAAVLEEELVEARRFRRSMVARAGEIDAAQRRTDETLRKLLS